jgi:O-antigen ligase
LPTSSRFTAGETLRPVLFRWPGGGAVAPARWPSLAAELFSLEAFFVLFLFAGRYKNLGHLRGFPIDLTLLFCALTIAATGAAMVSGRLKPAPPSLTQLFMILFSGFTVLSLAWSGFLEINIDKVLRFLFLTTPSFFVADILARDRARRSRFLRLLMLFSCVFLLYYVYLRYALGIAMRAGRIEGDNYLEYGYNATFLFISCLAVAALGSSKQLWPAALVAGAALYGLLIIGGRGPLALALLAIPLLALGLWRRAQSLRRLMLLGGLTVVAAVAYLTFAPGDRADGAAGGGFYTLQRYQSQLMGADRSMDQRFVGRQLALRLWLEKPLVGWGVGEFKVADPYLEYPHNTPLEILAEMGLVGFCLFLCVCVPAARDSVRLLGNRASGWPETAIALLFLTELAAHLTVAGNLADDRVLFAFMGLAIGSGATWAQDRRRPASVAAVPPGARLQRSAVWVRQ